MTEKYVVVFEPDADMITVICDSEAEANTVLMDLILTEVKEYVDAEDWNKLYNATAVSLEEFLKGLDEYEYETPYSICHACPYELVTLKPKEKKTIKIAKKVVQ
jgi:hypothetical protein